MNQATTTTPQHQQECWGDRGTNDAPSLVGSLPTALATKCTMDIQYLPGQPSIARIFRSAPAYEVPPHPSDHADLHPTINDADLGCIADGGGRAVIGAAAIS